MKNSLWVIIVIVAGFLGLLIGYSVPSFIESGVIGSGPNKVKAGTNLDKQTKEYYKNLLKEE